VASQIWDPQVGSVECGVNKCVAALKLAETAFVLLLTFLAACCVALVQDSSNPPGENPSEENSKIVEISFDSGCVSSTFNQAYDRAFGSFRTNAFLSNRQRRRYWE
jgi:hypothetical protein